jgi:hypothetical protein
MNINEVRCEIKRIINQEILVMELSSCLFSRILKIKIYETDFPLLLYGYETLSLTLRKEHKL